MSKVKIYVKRGKHSIAEKKLIEELQDAISKKIESDGSFTVNPASNIDELKQLHRKYCVTDVEFEDVRDESESDKISVEKEHTDFRKGMEESMSDSDSNLDVSELKTIDPFNKSNPIIRDYVLKDEYSSEKVTNPYGDSSSTTNFGEPVSFNDAFEIPSENNGTEQKLGGSSETQQKQKEKKQEPLNPAFDDMNASKKRRNTKRFAKYIVETVCFLSEKGFVWFANKDINEGKLAEYEISGEVDLSLLVTLDNGQEATVKEFFIQQCFRAEQLSKISPDEKEDLAETLAEVMLEKGVAPTPTQELLLISIKIFGGQAVTLFTLKAQTNSLLNQLKAMNEGREGQTQVSEYKEPQHTHTTPPPVTPIEKTVEEKKELKVETKQTVAEFEGESDMIDDFINSKIKETKE